MFQQEECNAMIIGTLKEITQSFKIKSRNMYRAMVYIARKSDVEDHIWVVIPEDVISKKYDINSLIGKKIEVKGKLRSRKEEGGDRQVHSILYVLAESIRICRESEPDENYVNLRGNLCKDVVFRYTPFGKKITELLVCVKRNYNQSSAIPCIAWGRGADYAKKLVRGDNVILWGRLQSRNYSKEINNKAYIVETFEVSIYEII